MEIQFSADRKKSNPVGGVFLRWGRVLLRQNGFPPCCLHVNSHTDAYLSDALFRPAGRVGASRRDSVFFYSPIISFISVLATAFLLIFRSSVRSTQAKSPFRI